MPCESSGWEIQVQTGCKERGYDFKCHFQFACKNKMAVFSYLCGKSSLAFHMSFNALQVEEKVKGEVVVVVVVAVVEVFVEWIMV